ncbi:MAG: hypothetical protein AAF441_12310 [Pseudomonadota bacterium]
MLQTSDLKAAVDEGIISSDQAVQLEAFARRLAGSTSGERMSFVQDTRDEPFRLLRGFRDAFIALGVIIFSFGVTGVAALMASGVKEAAGQFHLLTRAGLVEILLPAVLLAVGFGMAEWITRHQRLPLASMFLSLIIAGWSAVLVLLLCAVVVPDAYGRPDNFATVHVLPLVVGGVLGLVGFYWRYRLPFALLPLAACIVFALYWLLRSAVAGEEDGTFTLLTIGGLGLGVFAAAMWFDMKDPLRVTRFSECAFWLHLFAAPMIVHALLGFWSDFNIANAVALVIAVLVLALVAIVLDRRALLVSGLSYFAIAISQIVALGGFFEGAQVAITAFVLGVAVLGLGLGWTPVRRVIVSAIPRNWLTDRIPPVATSHSQHAFPPS